MREQQVIHAKQLQALRDEQRVALMRERGRATAALHADAKVAALEAALAAPDASPPHVTTPGNGSHSVSRDVSRDLTDELSRDHEDGDALAAHWELAEMSTIAARLKVCTDALDTDASHVYGACTWCIVYGALHMVHCVWCMHMRLCVVCCCIINVITCRSNG